MEEKRPTGKGAIITITVFILLLAGAVYWKMNTGNSTLGPMGSGGTGAGKAPPQKVTGFIALSKNIPINIESSGSLLAWNEVQLMPEMSGRIVQMAIKEGLEVQEGQLLIKIFDEDLKAQIKKQELQYRIAAKNVERLQNLLKINGVSQQEIDIAENQLNNIQSDVEIIKANLKKTEIRAPFSGKIGLTNASPGSFASMGSPLAGLQQLDALKIEFSIPEKYSPQLAVGDLVRFTLESQPDTFSARVYAFEPKINISDRSLKIRARFENPGRRLIPGSFARVQVRLREIKNAVLVPNESLIPNTRGKSIIVYRNGFARFIPVETGVRNANLVQITKGIQPGDTVINTGLMFVKPDTEIILTKVQ